MESQQLNGTAKGKRKTPPPIEDIPVKKEKKARTSKKKRQSASEPSPPAKSPAPPPSATAYAPPPAPIPLVTDTGGINVEAEPSVSGTNLELVLKWKTKLFQFLYTIPAIQASKELLPALKQSEESVTLPVLMFMKAKYITPFKDERRWNDACANMLRAWYIDPAVVDDSHKQRMGGFLQWLDRWFDSLAVE